jgi:fructose-bisphosphate aldolase class I
MINEQLLKDATARLTIKPKGILAADESSATCNKRFEKLGIATTEENRRAYRELLISAPELENYISGIILFDETIRQSTKDGKTFVSLMNLKGIDVGIKVDAGLKDLPGHEGEKFTDGLVGLPERLQEYHNMGATFAKWRAVYTVGENLPSAECMKINAEALAEYALMCQEKNIVPIIEPEVLFDGSHTIEECFASTSKNLNVVFATMMMKGVYIPGVILKTSMVLAGKDAVKASTPNEVANMTLQCLKDHVPADIGGIVFLSGGQDADYATKNLNAMHKGGDLPWALTFSYSRGIQNSVIEYWAKNPSDVAGAQKILIEMCKKNSLASIGQYE